MPRSMKQMESLKRTKARKILESGANWGVFRIGRGHPDTWGCVCLASEHEEAIELLARRAAEWSDREITGSRLAVCMLVWDRVKDQFHWMMRHKVSPSTIRKIVRDLQFTESRIAAAKQATLSEAEACCGAGSLTTETATRRSE